MAVTIDLSGKTALVTGVADDVGFGWHIARALQAAGADVVISCHPRVTGIVERFLTREKFAESRRLPYGAPGELKAKALVPCDVSFDSASDITDAVRAQKGYEEGDFSIDGCMKHVAQVTDHLDIVIHSVAFSPEIQKTQLDVSRQAYLTAMTVSSYSLIALTRAALPLMKGRQGSILGLTYIASERVIPWYGGGMAAAKAALECDARYLSWFIGEEGHRVNIISAGPYGSRAARSIGVIDMLVTECAKHSPLRRSIDGDDVANAALYLCSPLASAVTGTCLFVDAGFHAMGA